MERVSGSEYTPSGSIDKSKVLNVKPLRSLAPVFPSQPGQTAPFTCAPPTGPFPPFYPYFVPNESQGPTPNHAGPFGFTNPIPSPVPLNSYRIPPSQYSNGDSGPSRRGTKNRSGRAAHGDDYSNSQNQSDQYGSGSGSPGHDEEDTSNRGKRKGKLQRKTRDGVSLSSYEVNIDDIVDNFLRAFKLMGLAPGQQADGDKDLVGRILMVYNLLRRRIFQIDEAKEAIPGIT